MSNQGDIIAHHAAGTLPELLIERLRGHHSDEFGASFRATLTKLHNDGAIDLLEPARRIASSPIDQHQFFTVMHIYTELIPNLDAEVPAMLAAVKALVARAGNDGAAGMPNGAYRTWAEKDNRAQATLSAIDPESPENSTYMYLGLQALAKSDPSTALDAAISYLGGGPAPARSAAAKAIGTFALVTLEARQRAADALTLAAPGTDDNSLGQILAAMCEIARAHPDITTDAVALISACVPECGDQAIHHLSLEFMFHADELPPEIVAGLNTIMHKVAITSRGTIENIDAAGGKLARHNRIDEALALITPLISSHDELTSLETLDAFSYALLQLPSERLAQVVMGWLLALDPNLGRAAMSLIGDHHGDEPLILRLDGAALDLPDADRILLAHRAIGWLFLHPVTAASLVVGLLEGAGDAAAKVIADLLFDPLLINFSGSVSDWLAKRAEDSSDRVRPIIADLLTRLEVSIGGLRRVGRIKELRPSERERLIENHRQHEAMRQAHKRAEKTSIFASFATRQVLLYGTRSISYFTGPGGRKQRSETEMHSFSHSIESPRLDILEPFDLDYMLRAFRAMRKATP